MPIPDELLTNVPNKMLRYLSLSIFSVPRYRYFLTAHMKRCGPEQWERLRILQACERLEIPFKIWPKWKFPELPRGIKQEFRIPDRFDIPPFRPLEESIAEWKTRCHQILNDSLEKYAQKLNAQFQEALKRGIYTKIPQTRTTTDLDLRYEWVAQRICYRKQYKELASGGYSAERIKQSVLQILKKARLKEGI
jgi:hypothetical protein